MVEDEHKVYVVGHGYRDQEMQYLREDADQGVIWVIQATSKDEALELALNDFCPDDWEAQDRAEAKAQMFVAEAYKGPESRVLYYHTESYEL